MLVRVLLSTMIVIRIVLKSIPPVLLKIGTTFLCSKENIKSHMRPHIMTHNDFLALDLVKVIC